MAASSVAATVFQVPAGLPVDGTRSKRLLIAASGLAVGAGRLLIVMFPRFPAVVAAQAVLGAASAIIPPAIAAVSLGLVGRRLLDGRVSRNESFNHAGSVLAPVLAGTLGTTFGYHWIFYFACAFALASAAVTTLINPAEIDHERARGGEDGANKCKPAPTRDLLRRRCPRVFLASVVLFRFGNAAMLPMAGQAPAQTHPRSGTAAPSACIIAAQFVMVGVAWAVGRALARGVGRKASFLVAMAVLPVCGVLFTLTSSFLRRGGHPAPGRVGGGQGCHRVPVQRRDRRGADPAVAAVARAARAEQPLPYLLAWLPRHALPSLLPVPATYAALLAASAFGAQLGLPPSLRGLPRRSLRCCTRSGPMTVPQGCVLGRAAAGRRAVRAGRGAGENLRHRRPGQAAASLGATLGGARRFGGRAWRSRSAAIS